MTFIKPSEPANPEELKEVTVKSREEIETLKNQWKMSRCDWDIYETPGFEAHYEELRTYQELYEAEIEAAVEIERQARHDEMEFFMGNGGLNRLQEVTVRLAAARINNPTQEYKTPRQTREGVIDECVSDALYLLKQTTSASRLPVTQKPKPAATPNSNTVKLGATYTAIVTEPVNGLVKLEASGKGAFLPYPEVEGMREGQRVLVSVVAFTAKGLIMVSREDAHHQLAIRLEEQFEAESETDNG